MRLGSDDDDEPVDARDGTAGLCMPRNRPDLVHMEDAIGQRIETSSCLSEICKFTILLPLFFFSPTGSALWRDTSPIAGLLKASRQNDRNCVCSAHAFRFTELSCLDARSEADGVIGCR